MHAAVRRRSCPTSRPTRRRCRARARPGPRVPHLADRTTTSRSSASASTTWSRTATTSSCAPCPAPGWASCAPTRCSRRPSASCRRRPRRGPARSTCWCWPRPTRGRPCTGRSTSTTSASRSSTPTARWSGSAASSGCSPPRRTPSRVNRIPVLREKATQVIERAGYEPHSHAGKALMDVLETYPRDELFQTPVDDLVPIADAVHAHRGSAASCGCSCDGTSTAASCPAWSTCRATATTRRCARRSRTSSRSAWVARASTSRRGSASRCGPAALRRPPARGRGARDVDTDGARARARRGRPVLGRRPRRGGARRERRGRGRAAGRACTATRFPRRTRRTTAPADGAVDLCRLATDGRGRPGAVAGARRRATGDARLKIFRTGGPLSLSEVLPTCRRWASRSSTSGPTSSRAMPHPTYIYDFGLRWTRSLAEVGGRAVPGRPCSRSGQDRNESDGFNALVLAAGISWRQAMVLRAYAQLPAPGRHAVLARSTSRTRCAPTSTSPGYLVKLFEARFDPGRNGDIAADARGAHGEVRGPRVPDRPLARRGGRPRPGPHPARLPDHDPGHPAHQLLPARGRRPGAPAAPLPLAEARPVRASPTCRSRGRSSRSSSTRPASRACTCGSAPWPAVGCAGPTAATTSAPRCSAWSRRRWSRTP